MDLETAAVSIPGVDLEADRGAGLTEARAGVSAAPMASALVQASLHKVLESFFILYFVKRVLYQIESCKICYINLYLFFQLRYCLDLNLRIPCV